MKIIDVYCEVGKPPMPPPKYSKNGSELQRVMSSCGIDEALVYHSATRYVSPLIGNKLILEETSNSRNLHPAWAILPYLTGEMRSPDEFISEAKEKGIRFLYSFPAEHGYILDEIGFGGLFEELIEHRMPLLVKPAWPMLMNIIRQFPKLVMICVGHGPHGQDRYFRPLLERYESFYIDTSTYLLDGGIEDLCSRYGAHRLLFGTGYPYNCRGGSLLRLMASSLSSSDKEMVFGVNFQRILNGVKV